MIDRLFTPVLTFGLLLGGTLAIGSEMFGLNRENTAIQAAAAPVRVVPLQHVVVTAKRPPPSRVVAVKVFDETSAARTQ